MGKDRMKHFRLCVDADEVKPRTYVRTSPTDPFKIMRFGVFGWGNRGEHVGWFRSPSGWKELG